MPRLFQAVCCLTLHSVIFLEKCRLEINRATQKRATSCNCQDLRTANPRAGNTNFYAAIFKILKLLVCYYNNRCLRLITLSFYKLSLSALYIWLRISLLSVNIFLFTKIICAIAVTFRIFDYSFLRYQRRMPWCDSRTDFPSLCPLKSLWLLILISQTWGPFLWVGREGNTPPTIYSSYYVGCGFTRNRKH